MTNPNLMVINRPVLARHHPFRSNTRRVQRLDLQAAPRTFFLHLPSIPMPNDNVEGEEGRRRQRNALAVSNVRLNFLKTRVSLRAMQCGRCRQRKIKCEGDEGQGCQACRNAGLAKCNYRRVQSQDIDPRALEIIGVPVQVHSGDIHEIEVLSPISTASPNQWNLALNAQPMRSDPSQYSISNAGQPAQFAPNALLYSNDQTQYNCLEDAGYGTRRSSSRLVHNSRGSVNQTGNPGLPQLASTRNSSLTGSSLSSQVSESSCFTPDSSSAMSEGLTSWTPQNPYPPYLADSSSYYPGMSPAIRQLPQPSNASNLGPRNSISSLNGLPRQQDQFLYDEDYDLGKMLPEGSHPSVGTVAPRVSDTPYSPPPRDHRSSLHGTAAQDEVTRANRAGTYLAPAREVQQTYHAGTTVQPSPTYMTTSNQPMPYTRFPNADLGWEFWNPRNTPANEAQDGGRVAHHQEHRHFRNIQARPRRPDSSDGNRN